MKAYQPAERTLNLISCCGHDASAAWGRLPLQGLRVWHLTDRLDHAFMARYTPHEDK
jgi:hypothetical protein